MDTIPFPHLPAAGVPSSFSFHEHFFYYTYLVPVPPLEQGWGSKGREGGGGRRQSTGTIQLPGKLSTKWMSPKCFMTTLEAAQVPVCKMGTASEPLCQNCKAVLYVNSPRSGYFSLLVAKQSQASVGLEHLCSTNEGMSR